MSAAIHGRRRSRIKIQHTKLELLIFLAFNEVQKQTSKNFPWTLIDHTLITATGKMNKNYRVLRFSQIWNCSAFHIIKSFVSWLQIYNYFAKIPRIRFAQGVQSLGFPGCFFEWKCPFWWQVSRRAFFPSFTLKWQMNSWKSQFCRQTFNSLCKMNLQ